MLFFLNFYKTYNSQIFFKIIINIVFKCSNFQINTHLFHLIYKIGELHNWHRPRLAMPCMKIDYNLWLFCNR
ncbi:hypothetical protein BpHYR1_045965 [Brachionus plicatilis]|uniref:Uncharacterized protein n=1 Tax=Brachionus plicatilis TaxID=10195 RepID=A0A3M7T6Q2_BRAPC|nr:hypothetical protein BpHYR1_045965 [Brachionus plicatilis]